MKRLRRIDAGETEALAGVTENLDAFVQAAGVDLPTALANAEPPLTRWAEALEVFNQRSTEIDTVEAEGLAGVQTSLDNFVDRAGVPLTEALNNAVEPMDRWTQALTTHAETIADIDAGETEAIGGVEETFAEVLETAGVPLTDALNNAQEPMTRFAAAGDRLSTSLDTINDRESSAIAALEMGLTDFVDRAGVPLTEALNNAVEPMDRWTQAISTHAETIADIDADETEAIGNVQTFLDDFIDRAGVPLTDALNNAVEPMDRWTQALTTHATAIEGINASELGGIEDAQARNPLAFSAPEEASTAQLENETAMTRAETAMTEATTAETEAATEMTRAETALTEAGTAVVQSEAIEAFTTTTEAFSETVDTFREGVDGLLTVPGLIENAFGVVSTQLTDIFTLTTTIAQRLLIPTAPAPPAFVVEGARNAAAPGSSGGGSDERPIVIENRTTVELEGEKVGQAIGNKIVQQGANRRNALGQAALRR